MEVSGAAENVLDLCVRKREREEYDDETDTEIDIKYEIDIDSDINRNSCDVKPPLLLQQQLHKPVLSHADPNHSATLAYLQERIYADVERRQSPPYYPGDSPSSNGSLSSESLHLSPTFYTISRAMANVTTRGGKPTRPFKAYPKETLLASSNKDYNEFRAAMLAKVQGSNCKNGNKNMKRPVQAVSPHQLPSSTGDVKDQAYWEKRKKNNEAAKRSRDARRAKEDELAIRTAFLEEENIRLKLENEMLRNQLDKILNSPRGHPSIYA